MKYRLVLATTLLMSPESWASDSIRPSLDHRSRIEHAAPAHDWSGITVGAHIGIANTDGGSKLSAHTGAIIQTDINNGLFPRSTSESASSALASISLGYDQQFGSFVAGLEADYSITDINSRYGMNRLDPNPAFFGVRTISGYETSLSDLVTARMRLGLDLGNTLVYATGGFASGEVYNQVSLQLPDLGVPFLGREKTSYKTGYVVGAGFDHRLTNNVRLRAEYQFINLQDKNIHVADDTILGGAFTGETFTYKFENEFSVAKLGLVYSF